MGMFSRLIVEEMEASYEEVQSRLRLSMLCKACVRPRGYPLNARIVELLLDLDARRRERHHLDEVGVDVHGPDARVALVL